MEKELSTRQFRKHPFCWQEKIVLRLLKKIYLKRLLPSRRSVYLALTEIESDFGNDFIKNYTKTISTYAGVNRHLVSKILKEFERYNIIKTSVLRNSEGRFSGKLVFILEAPVVASSPMDKRPTAEMPYKNLDLSKKIEINKKWEKFNKKKRELLKAKAIDSRVFSSES